MNEMKKVILTVVIAVFATSGMAQSDCGELLDHNQDGIIGVEDLMNLLSFFGQPLESMGGPCGDIQTLNFDGYNYDVVAVGEQCWFAENLRSTHYSNGDALQSELGDDAWSATTDGAVTLYGQSSMFDCIEYSSEGDACDSEWFLQNFGRLYNWHAVADDRGLCPSNWHVPSDADWMTLEVELGMALEDAMSSGVRGTTEGLKIKSVTGWYDNEDGNNVSGLSCSPAGNRQYGNYDGAGYFGLWWTATDTANGNARNRYLTSYPSGSSRIGRGLDPKCFGFSVRCVKDSE